MSARLQSRWEFRGSADWITAVDEIHDELVFVGSRDGWLYVLNRHGARIARRKFGSWIGALKVIDTRRQWTPAMLGIHLLVGTKHGDITCLRIDHVQEDDVTLTDVFVLQAGNTIREIDAISVEQSRPDVWIAAGSEDRHVYRFNLSDIIEHGFDAPVKSVAVNGWLRSVAFTRDALTDEPVVAAGCGDKNIYFLTERDFGAEVGTAYTKVFVNAKIHSIIADQRSSTVFCTSDAKQLSVITWTGEQYAVQHEKALPHRATRLTFADPSCETILAACEDENIYVYDIAAQEIISYIPVGERMFAIRGASTPHSGLLMLGLAHGRLTCCVYSLGAGLPELPRPTVRGTLSSFAPNDFGQFAETLLYGPKRTELEVGIGRFLHIAAPRVSAPASCVVGTDEGSVVVVRLESQPAIVHRENFSPARVWAVDAEWRDSTRLHVVVATSDAELASLLIDFQASPSVVVEDKRLPLDDWPREIRRVEGVETPAAESLLVCCENGDLLVLGDREVRLATGQTLRTGYACVHDQAYEIVTGSDDALVTRFSDSQELWRRDTLDRVREVLIDGDKCLAVSEDRFLYVLSHEGALQRRYRFPHRALCIDLLVQGGQRLYVVGCGDGAVYILGEDGVVNAAYEFPDRIRDVKVLDGHELIVACEDGNVYFAPTIDDFLSEYYPARTLGAIINKASELRLASQAGDAAIVVSELADVERLCLLAYVEHWFLAVDDELAIALIDATEPAVRASRSPRWSYAFAHALVFIGFRVNLAAGRSRIEAFAQAARYNAYALHALLCAIPAMRRPGWGNEAAARVLVDAIVVNTPIEDEWICEEMLEQLSRAGFFSLGSEGFCQYFRSTRIPYRKLTSIISSARAIEREALAGAPIVQLEALLERPGAGRDWLAQVRALGGEEPDDEYARHLAKLELLLSRDTDEDVLDELSLWAAKEFTQPDALSLVSELFDRFSTERDRPPALFELLADLIHARLLQSDYDVCASEYLSLLFLRSFVQVCKDRSAASTMPAS